MARQHGRAGRWPASQRGRAGGSAAHPRQRLEPLGVLLGGQQGRHLSILQHVLQLPAAARQPGGCVWPRWRPAAHAAAPSAPAGRGRASRLAPHMLQPEVIGGTGASHVGDQPHARPPVGVAEAERHCDAAVHPGAERPRHVGWPRVGHQGDAWPSIRRRSAADAAAGLRSSSAFKLPAGRHSRRQHVCIPAQKGMMADVCKNLRWKRQRPRQLRGAAKAGLRCNKPHHWKPLSAARHAICCQHGSCALTCSCGLRRRVLSGAGSRARTAGLPL